MYVPETEQPDEKLVIIFISIGYEEKKGVNFISFVFAPDYDNEDSEKEFSFTVGAVTNKMNFVNIAFTQQDAFMGLKGVHSQLGLPINMLGVVQFTCADPSVDETNSTIRQDGVTVEGGGSLISEAELEEQEAELEQ